jgi:hypothetical protein
MPFGWRAERVETDMSDPGSLDGGSTAPASQPAVTPQVQTPVAVPAPAPAPRFERTPTPPNPRSGEAARRELREGAARDAAPPADGTKKIGDLELNESQARDLLARDALEKSKALTRPQTPADYKFSLSPEFKAPQGVEFKLNENDPLVGKYRDFAHRHGFDQNQFSEGLDLIGAMRLEEHQQFAHAKTAELNKLGPNSHARVSAVVQWMASLAGDKARAAVRVLEQAPVATTIEALETIMHKYGTQGAAPFNGGGRDPGDVSSNKIPGYAGMSFEQRRQAQDQQRERGGR